MPEPDGLPLTGLRVVDLADGKAEMCGRVLADLGAGVIKVEPPGGSPARTRPPLHDGVSLTFAVRNANKRGVILDLLDPGHRDRLFDLAESADILIESGKPGVLARMGLSADTLLDRNPALVVVSITDFGQTGPYKDWAATNWTHLALGGVLSRSGLPDRPPILPPGDLAYESASVQAAFTALLAYYHRLDTGLGDHVDCSVYEMTAQALDPGLGISGSASGDTTAFDLPRGRPPQSELYPIYQCADGYVRIAVLSRRQWRSMFAWLGKPQELADPKYEISPARRAAKDLILPAISAHVRHMKKDDLTELGVELGIPIQALKEPGEVLQSPHFLARGGLIDAEYARGRIGRIPSGFLEINGKRAGFRHRAPEPGEHDGEVFAEAMLRQSGPRPAAPLTPGRPLAGIRVLDLGIIVAGAETGRLLADQGAEVIKIESSAYPDSVRPQEAGGLANHNVVAGFRNKLSIGINLRSAEGLGIFKRLVEKSDVVLSNFKPGTMEALGLGFDVLSAINPRIVVADSSALGSRGPWSRRMGYGPLVRSGVGLTGLWRDVGVEGGFSDGSTIYPDHTAARVSVAGVLAALINARRTGKGATVSVALAETVLTQFSAEFLRESLEPGTMVASGNHGEFDAPQGVYPCAGDDDWCVVTVEGDDEWRELCRVLDRPDLSADARLAASAGRLANRALVDQAVSAWTRTVAPREAMRQLQEAGVPAGFLQRIADYFEDPQLVSRAFMTAVNHPYMAAPRFVERGPAHFRYIAEPEGRPAPLRGEQTRQVAEGLLGLDADEVQALVDSGVLEVSPLEAK